MNINSLSFLKFNKISGLQLKNQVEENQQRKISSNFNINCYPKNYYLNQISFGLKNRFSANDLIANIGEENFPSQEIVKTLRKLGNSKDYSLYDIHIKHYENLLNCSTLEEAKQKYPEFKNVIDANNIDYKLQNKKSMIYKIANKEVPNVDIKNLSLELLKKRYGQLLCIPSKKNFYNLCSCTIYSLFNLLNIKNFDKKYHDYVLRSSDENKSMLSKRSKKLWEDNKNAMYNATHSQEARQKRSNRLKQLWTDNREAIYNTTHSQASRQKRSAIMTKRWANNENNIREIMSILMQNRWTNDDGSFRKKIVESGQTLQARQNKSNGQKRYWADDEEGTKKQKRSEALKVLENTEQRKKFRAAQRLAWDMHPEITDAMSNVAKANTWIIPILDKIRKHVELTDEEQNMYKNYFIECDRAVPGFQKIIGQEVRKILIEWGIKEDKSEEDSKKE